MPAITLLLKWRRNVWPIRNAGEPGTSFISAQRNVCWVNFLHQSWVMGGDFPLVSGVCLYTQRPAIADEPSEIRGTSSLWEYSVVGCAFMQQRIIFPLFLLPLWAYILFMNSWELASHVWLYVCVRVSAGNFFIWRPQWLDSKIHPMFELLDQPNMIDEFQNRVRLMNDCLLRVKVACWEDKPAMDKTLLSERFCLLSWSEVFVLLLLPPLSLLKKPSVIMAPVFYTLPSNWCWCD